MFVSWTAKGILAARLRQLEDRLAGLTGFRIKYVEEGGTPLWRQLASNLDSGVGCGRNKCVTCTQDDEKKLNCYQRSVVYESSCLKCHPGGNKEKQGEDMVLSGFGLYTGETSRSVFERVGEHMKNASVLDRESHIVKHWFLSHPEDKEPPGFKFRVVGQYKDCLSRQVKEAVRIQNRPGNLNSKGEFGGGRIPRLTIEKDEFEKKREELEERIRKEKEDFEWEEFLSGKYNETEQKKKRKVSASCMEVDSENILTKKTKKKKNELLEGRTECVAIDIKEDEVQDGPLPEGGRFELIPEGRRDVVKVELPMRVSSPPTSVTGVMVRGGRGGKGAKCMTVRDIADHFKNISNNKIETETLMMKNSPKRKLKEDHLDSPTKKLRTKFWETLDGTDK